MATTKKPATVKKATAAKKPVAEKAAKIVDAAPQHIGLVQNDPWLEPFEGAIRGRHDHALWKISQLTKNGKSTLSDFASGHLYFGLHKLAKGWVFREWAPNATFICTISRGDTRPVATLEMMRSKSPIWCNCSSIHSRKLGSRKK